MKESTRSARPRRVMLLILVIAMFTVVPAVAQTSVGVMVGEPTAGISVKQWLGGQDAVDLLVAWSFVNVSALYVHVDYQHHFDDIDIDEGDLQWFAGIGGRVHIAQDLRLGARVPVGLFYLFAEIPIELFLEIAPGLDLFPAIGFDMAGGIGARYRF